MDFNITYNFEGNVDFVLNINNEMVNNFIIQCSMLDIEEKLFESVYISKDFPEWSNLYEMLLSLSDKLHNKLGKYTQFDLVKKSGWSVGHNNFDEIMTLTKNINKDNILELIHISNGYYFPCEKYVLKRENNNYLETSDDLEDYINYKFIVKMLPDDEYKELYDIYIEAIEEMITYIKKRNLA